MDVDFIVRPKFMLPPYAPEFNRWRVPRMVANLKAIDYLVENKDQIPSAQTCLLGPLDETRTQDAAYLQAQIESAVQSGRCEQGIYATASFVFRATQMQVQKIHEVDRQ